MLGCSERIRFASIWLLLGLTVMPLAAKQRATPEKRTERKIIEVKEPDGQILSYRQDMGSREVTMRGTRLAPEAHIRLKVESRPGFVELDINRGNIQGLKPAHLFGKDFLTYVMWAVSVDGKASNLGEITFQDERAVSINVTTAYQTFWLMVTAEPDYAVVEPSPLVVLYSVNQGAVDEALEKMTLTLRGNLFFFTSYTAYDSTPATEEAAPHELLQARKAVELASKSGTLIPDRPASAASVKETTSTREALKLATTFLARAEDAYKKNPQGGDVVQLARTAAQIAENARALAVGVVGGLHVAQLESGLDELRAELAGRQTELTKLRARLRELQAQLAKLRAELANAQAIASKAIKAPPVETKAAPPPESLASKPIVWFGLLGWGLALLLLFRRRSV